MKAFLSVAPLLVVVSVILDTDHVLAAVDERFSATHLEKLNEIASTMDQVRTEKQNEFQKMKDERAKQRAALENEKKRLQEDLKNDRARQFEDIKNANLEEFEQYKGILYQIKTTIESAEDKKLGFTHLSLLRNISDNLEGSKQDSVRHFQDLQNEDQEHHAKIKDQIKKDHEELKKERNQQFKNLKDTTVLQHQELKSIFKNIMSMLDQPRDCYEMFKNGVTTSGVYVIKPDGFPNNFYVFCDMVTDGGGWTVIQRRKDYGKPVQTFAKNWQEYKDGFGKLKEEFWLGNDKISALTQQKNTQLKVDMMDFSSSPSQALFANFKVDNEENEYRLTVSGYKGKSIQTFTSSSGQTFSTQDRNTSPEQSCATKKASGWWFISGCSGSSNLNGLRQKDEFAGIIWDGTVPLQFSEMKIRPADAEKLY